MSQLEVKEKVIDIAAEKEDPILANDIEVTISDEVLPIQQFTAAKYFAYSQLDKEEQETYRKIYQMLLDYNGEIDMGKMDPDNIDRIFLCVTLDCPEFFYVKGYNLTKYELSGKLKNYTISGMYTMEPEKIERHKEKVEERVNEILAGAPDTNDDYEKIKYVYDYIAKNTEYDRNAKSNQNFLSVFEGNKSVCQGYTKAFQYLLTKMGIFCTMVQGTSNDESHAWNMVKSNGDYYYVDVTWGDASYEFSSDGQEEVMLGPEINYDFLCATSADMAQTHTLNMPYKMPKCIQRSDYYYVREGAYFEGVDEYQLDELFSKAISEDRHSIIIKCADKDVYEAMFEHLIDEKNIFVYMDSESIDYACMDDIYEFIFQR